MYNAYMKKQVIIALSIIIIALLGGLYFYFHKQINSPDSQTVNKPISPTIYHQLSPTNGIKFCTPQDLQASLSVSAGAGNIYGKFSLKNISKSDCQILGGDFIFATYDTNIVKNITITHIGETQVSPFILSNNSPIYSQVHFPNGPQCNSIGINPVNVTFTYKISPTENVTFKNQNGEAAQVVQTCKTPSDLTDIQIWNMSIQPITP